MNQYLNFLIFVNVEPVTWEVLEAGAVKASVSVQKGQYRACRGAISSEECKIRSEVVLCSRSVDENMIVIHQTLRIIG